LRQKTKLTKEITLKYKRKNEGIIKAINDMIILIKSSKDTEKLVVKGSRLKMVKGKQMSVQYSEENNEI